MKITIEQVAHLDDAAWGELEPLFRALHDYHAPLTGVVLAEAWEDAQRSRVTVGDDGLVLLARAGGGAVAFANAHIPRSAPVFEEHVGVLDSMYVRPEFRGQGVGRRLLAAVEQWCRGRGVEELRLNVAAANTAAIAIWRASGFVAASHVVSKRLGRPE